MSKESIEKENTMDRRAFLRKGAVLGAVATAAAIPAQSLASPADEIKNDAEKKASTQDGYKLSQHVVDYYKSAQV